MKSNGDIRQEKAAQGNLTLNDAAWKKLFEKYEIKKHVENEGIFKITANQIKEFREPRLMTKFDTKESLPASFGTGNGKKMSILPDSRGSYVIGYFDTYKELPEMASSIKHVDFPDYLQTIRRQEINSEANVINVLGVTNILENFLEEGKFVQTISGRMKSGVFDFQIADIKTQRYHSISVKNAQIEIDAGFENHDCVVLMEAKNVVHKDFIVRQLYYPYRLWKEQINKWIRPVFMVYSNNIFRLLEYEFKDSNKYSSISFVRQKNYSFEDVDIKEEDLLEAFHATKVQPEPPKIPFIQANSFHTVISLLELVKEEPKSTPMLSELIGFAERQGDYYYNAARYLGLTEKFKDADGVVKVRLSPEGKRVMALSYKQRQIAYIEKMFQHEIFRQSFWNSLEHGRQIDKNWIASKVRELRLCPEGTIERRTSSVQGWLRWIFASVNE